MRMSSQAVHTMYTSVTSCKGCNWEREGSSKFQCTTKKWESRTYTHTHMLQCEKGVQPIFHINVPSRIKMNATLDEKENEYAIRSLSIWIIVWEENNRNTLDVVDHVAQLLSLFFHGLYIISNLLFCWLGSLPCHVLGINIIGGNFSIITRGKGK